MTLLRIEIYTGDGKWSWVDSDGTWHKRRGDPPKYEADSIRWVYGR